MTSRGARLVLVFGVLLGASWLVRTFSDPPPLRDDQRAVQLHAVAPGPETGNRTDGTPVRLAYSDSGGDGPVVVLLHGSPAASGSVMGVHRELGRRGYRVLTPDLPGFGRSSEDIPWYSIRAHADYLSQWLTLLNIPSAHVVGYSMGGGVALEWWHQDSSQVRSLVMLSSIGVQELELTGDYYLNHAIHGLQLGALWLIRNTLPHFGLMDHVMLGVPYARNFYETDQRPLRGILKQFHPPMMILHGRQDPLVPYAAALEHHRLVPQSGLIAMEGGHELPFSRPDTVAGAIADFLLSAEMGSAPSRAEATPDRLQRAAVPFDQSSIPRPSGFAIAVLMLLVALATLASEDLASIGAGLMAARGTLTFPEATLAALGGIVIGDVGLYLAGRWFGRPMVRKAPFRWFLDASRLERGEQWFAEKGIRAVLIARFVPGTRLPTYLAAGVLRAPFVKFMGYFFLAALIWTPAIVAGAMILGQGVLTFYESYDHYAVWVVLGLALFLLLVFRLLPEAFTHEGRRRLKGRWMRLTTWEFWPPWVFYPPVVLYGLWLSIKYRGVLTFTAANPGIPDGGLVGESKHSILSQLDSTDVATYRVLDATVSAPAFLAQVRAFMQAHSLTYPVVLKPDVGERGRGVAIVRNDDEVLTYFRGLPTTSPAPPLGPVEAQTASVPLLVQRYVPGTEFGVFFYRDPGTGDGHIFSVTEKTFPCVTGDGVRNLRRLILDDPRAVALHATYERIRRDDLDVIPEKDQKVQLVELGTHCRGSVFLDRAQLITPALTAAVEAIAQSFTGFHFGRFDLRTPDGVALKEGRGLTVLELNGVTSEATHIYQPGFPLLRAWRTLFTQWELAYRIGAANRKRGATVSGSMHVLRALLSHARRVSDQQAGDR